jgi:hypothetical protein
MAELFYLIGNSDWCIVRLRKKDSLQVLVNILYQADASIYFRQSSKNYF